MIKFRCGDGCQRGVRGLAENAKRRSERGSERREGGGLAAGLPEDLAIPLIHLAVEREEIVDHADEE
jgi:hypothetical protein